MSQKIPQQVLILGANGRLGRELVTAFADAGWSVKAQARRPLEFAVAGDVQTLLTGVGDTRRLASEAAGSDVVIHAMNADYTRWDTDALPLAESAIALARQLRATLIFAGNVYNFGSRMPAVLRENALHRPGTRKGLIRLRTETRMRDEVANGLQSIVIRAGDFYGGAAPGSWMDQAIAKDLAKGKIVYPGPTHLPHAWAYLPDLARTFVAVAEARARCAPFENLHFAGNALTGRQLIDALSDAAKRAGVVAPGAAIRVGSLPWWALRLGAWAMPMWRELLEMKYLWDEAHALDQSRLVALLGQVPSTPLDIAMDRTLVGLGLASNDPAVRHTHPKSRALRPAEPQIRPAA